jgi:hypothetical protein
VAVKDIRLDNGGSEPTDDYKCLYGKRNANRHLATGFVVDKRIRSAVKREDFFNDRMPYITLRR